MSSKSLETPLVFSFFGPPGSGKGTLAEKCVQKLHYQVLSTGNLIRKYAALEDNFGKLLSSYINIGKLVPDELITEMTNKWLSETLTKNSNVILDGYPRTSFQVKNLVDFRKSSKCSFDFYVIYFHIEYENVVKRLAQDRLVCSNKSCQKVYSLVVNKPKVAGVCDSCGSSLIKREDDKVEIIRERLSVYDSYKNSVLDAYKKFGQKIIEINVENKTPDELFNDFLDIVEKIKNKKTFDNDKN